MQIFPSLCAARDLKQLFTVSPSRSWSAAACCTREPSDLWVLYFACQRPEVEAAWRLMLQRLRTHCTVNSSALTCDTLCTELNLQFPSFILVCVLSRRDMFGKSDPAFTEMTVFIEGNTLKLTNMFCLVSKVGIKDK